MTHAAHVASLALAHRWDDVLQYAIAQLAAESGTLHLLEADGLLHLASSQGIPAVVAETVRTVPIGKGMAGLAVERRRPVDACNIQTDATGDVRPGARATRLQGSIVVPLMHNGRALGALGVANRAERTFTDEEQRRLLDLGSAIAGAMAARPR